MFNRKKNSAEDKALRILYKEWLGQEAKSAKDKRNMKSKVTYENFAQILRENGMIADEVLVPMGNDEELRYIEEYKYGIRKRD